MLISQILAQTPPPATLPQSDLRPVLYTAGGALIGVILTVIVQLINSRHQRRHENEGKLFDLRVTTYSELLEMIDQVAARKQEHEEAEQKSAEHGRIAEELRERAQALQCHQTEDAAEPDLEQQLNKIAGQLDDCAAEINRQAEIIETVGAAYREATTWIRSSVPRLSLISSEETLKVVKRILETPHGELLARDVRQAFRKAVRRELGV